MENNNKITNKIKLMMSYEMGKTLNENLKSVPSLNETKVEVDEDAFLKGAVDAFKDAKSLKLANRGLFNALDDVLKVTAQEGKQIKGITKPGTVQHVAITDVNGLVNSIKSGMKPTEVAQLYKGLLKSKNTPANILQSLTKDVVESKKFINSYGKMTDKQLRVELANRGYSDLSIEALSKEAKTNVKFKNAKNKPVKGNSTQNNPKIDQAGATRDISADAKKATNAEEAGQVVVNVNTGNITQGAAAETNAAVRASKEITPEAKAVAEEAKKVVEEMKPSKWQKFKNIVRKLKPKYWILLGLAGVAGWYLWKFLKSLQPQKELFPKCLDALIDDEGTTIRATSGGDPVVSVISTGNRDYDQKGGLWFFNNGRVITVDQSKRGFWSCKGSDVTIAEQGDSNPRTGVDKVITIKWDGETVPIKSGGGDGGSGSGGGSDDTKPKVDNTKFHDCSQKDFPFEVGCISPKIAEVQKCLGVEPQKGYLGPKTISALIDLHFETKDGLTKDVYDKVMAACKESEPKPTDAPKVDTDKTDNPATAPITPPEVPAEPVFDKNRLQELLASKNLVKKRKGVIVKWKGEELSGEDYFILNKYLEDKGYIQKKQRETGDRDDEDVTMKYKWKQVGEE